MLRRASSLLVVALVVLAPTPALAQATGGQGNQVVLAGDVVVPRGTVVDEVVVFSGSATIAGVAQDDVVVLAGPVTIAGQVGGDVVALDGPVRLLRTAQVTGDVLGGDTVTVADGAHVGGTVRDKVSFTLAAPTAALGALLASAAIAVSALLVLLVGLLLAPRGLERVADTARTAPATTAAWGLAVGIAVPVAAVVAGATVLGLPLALALLLGAALLWIVGLAAASFAIGRLFVRPPQSRVGALFAGWGVTAVVGLVPVLNIACWTLAALFGLGAIVVTAWRSRRGEPSAPVGRGGRRGRHRAGSVTSVPAPVSSDPASARPSDMPLAED